MALSVWPALAASPPRVQWTKRFVGLRWAVGNCVEQTADGGYIAAGETGLRDTSLVAAIFLIKTDSFGNTEWKKTIRGALAMRARSVQQTTDGGHIVGADGGLWPGWVGGACLIKTDGKGDIQWQSEVSDTTKANGCWAVQTADGRYAVTATQPGDSGLLLIKADRHGQRQWFRRYAVAYPFFGSSDALPLKQTMDGGYIMGTKGLLKADSLGSQQWLRKFDDVACVNSVIQTPDGGYVATGRPQGNTGINLFKTDAKGNPQWGKTYASSEKSGGRWVEQTADGYVIAAYSRSGDRGIATVIRTKSDGTLLWVDSLCVGRAACVRRTSDGGYIVTGDRPRTADGDQSMFLTKLAPEGK
jgi:hypothetical protein